MKYILDELEYAEYVKTMADAKRLPTKETLQEVCTQIADNWPSFKGWDGKDEPRPWGCIITARDYEWYCDECPVIKICPKERKHWSK